MKKRTFALMLASFLVFANLQSSLTVNAEGPATADTAVETVVDNVVDEAEGAVLDNSQEATIEAEEEELSETAGTVDAEAEEVAEESEEEAADTEEAVEESAEAVTEEEIVEATATDEAQNGFADSMKEGINEISNANGTETSFTDETFNIDAGKALQINGTDEYPVTFTNCTFNITGDDVKFNVEKYAKLSINGNVTFTNCTFTIGEGGYAGGGGNSSAIRFEGSKTIKMNQCTIKASGHRNQLIGLYGNAVAEFNGSTITVDNCAGWIFASYGKTVFKFLDGTNIKVTETQRRSSANTNVFYAGDSGWTYPVLYIEDSAVDFSDNYSGGFVLNSAMAQVKNSTITVCNNLGNASNSGGWEVENSTINFSNNRSGHGISADLGMQAKNSTITVIHNGYSGLNLRANSTFENCEVTVLCNGEKLGSYSAGDVWTNSTLTFKNCTKAWLGGVSANTDKSTGNIVNEGSSEFVAYDIKDVNGRNAALASASDKDDDENYLFKNPKLTFDYARAYNYNGTMLDENLLDVYDPATIAAKDAKLITVFSTADLAHHTFDFSNPELVQEATADQYGIVKYSCTECDKYLTQTTSHPYSFDCKGEYVYGPVVGLTFDKNTTDEVSGMPEDQTQIEYNGTPEAPTSEPTREGYTFTGWFTDAENTTAFDFKAALTANWTIAYAGWVKNIEVEVSKTWSDDNDRDGLRADSVTVKLLADGKDTGKTVTLDESNDWTATFEDLAPEAEGKEIAYTVKEKSVPAGYTAAVSGSAKDGFVITNSHTPKEEPPKTPEEPPVTPPDKPHTGSGSVAIIKVDAETGAYLQGATFELYRSNGELVGTYTTDERGWLKVENLIYSTYYFVETKAPEGYVTDGSHINFELTEAKSAGNAYPWNIKVENSKEKAPVVVESTPTLATPAAPLATTAGHTGDESNMMLYLAMMALAAAGIAVYGFKRHANR